ncbi:MAG: AEC family transporter [Clostridia bacterium]|nr:AEC family transporter [Clostridia bacterium]
MSLNFFEVLLNISILMLLGVPGFILRKTNVLKSQDSKSLAVLLLYITQPFLIIMSFQGKTYEREILGSLGIIAIGSIAIHLIMLAIAYFVFSKISLEKKQKGVFTFASTFANCGYMGIPVISMLFFGKDYLAEMLIYVSVYITVFNVINWTVGIYIISGDKRFISIKNAVLNPATIATLIALPLFFAKINLSSISVQLTDAFNLLGNMTTPISMIIIGLKLAEMPFKEIFSSKYVYLTTFLKLIVMPLIMYCLLLPFKADISPVVIAVLLIISAMPTAANTVANADRFGGDSLNAAKAMLCSTILCVLTLPVITLLI